MLAFVSCVFLNLSFKSCKSLASFLLHLIWPDRKRRDSNPRTGHPAFCFQDRRIRPLCHSSAIEGRHFASLVLLEQWNSEGEATSSGVKIPSSAQSRLPIRIPEIPPFSSRETLPSQRAKWPLRSCSCEYPASLLPILGAFLVG